VGGPHGLRSDHYDCYCQNGQEPTKQLHDANGIMKSEMGEHHIFEEEVGYGKGYQCRYRKRKYESAT